MNVDFGRSRLGRRRPSLSLLLLAGHASTSPSKDHLLRNVLHCLQKLLLMVLAFLRQRLSVTSISVELQLTATRI